jgi:hypothetical protein
MPLLTMPKLPPAPPLSCTSRLQTGGGQRHSNHECRHLCKACQPPSRRVFPTCEQHREDATGGESFHRPRTAGHNLEGYQKAILLGVGGGGISLMRVIVGYGLDTPIQAMRLITWTGGKKETVGRLVR